MRRGLSGMGSASMLLIFTVLCMAMLALISLSYARTDSAMTHKWQAGVEAYYTADLLAERVLDAILTADEPINSAYGICISHYTDEETGESIAEYACPVDEGRYLCVSVALSGESCCNLREWRLILSAQAEGN